MNYKPFDLQRALAGDKFARKSDMKEPEDWHLFKTLKTEYPLSCVFNGKLVYYNSDGYCGLPGYYPHTLVMLSKTKKLWLKVAKRENEHGLYRTGYAVDETNNYLLMEDSNYQIIEIEIEVDE